jgi:hypothetical protein
VPGEAVGGQPLHQPDPPPPQDLVVQRPRRAHRRADAVGVGRSRQPGEHVVQAARGDVAADQGAHQCLVRTEPGPLGPGEERVVRGQYPVQRPGPGQDLAGDADLVVGPARDARAARGLAHHEPAPEHREVGVVELPVAQHLGVADRPVHGIVGRVAAGAVVGAVDWAAAGEVRQPLVDVPVLPVAQRDRLGGRGEDRRQGVERGDGVAALEVGRVRVPAQELHQRRDARVGGGGLDHAPGPVGVVQGPGGLDDRRRLLRRDHPGGRGRRGGVADVHQRHVARGEGPAGHVRDGHLVVRVDLAVAVHLVNPAVPDHPVDVELGGPQGAHAGAPDHPDPVVEQVQHLLVPHRRALVVVAVDDHHHVTGRRVEGQQVPVGDRRVQPRARHQRVGVGRAQRRSDEDVHRRRHVHDRPLIASASLMREPARSTERS